MAVGIGQALDGVLFRCSAAAMSTSISTRTTPALSLPPGDPERLVTVNTVHHATQAGGGNDVEIVHETFGHTSGDPLVLLASTGPGHLASTVLRRPVEKRVSVTGVDDREQGDPLSL